MTFQAIPLPTKDNLQLVATRMKLIIDQLSGAGGNGPDTAVTFRTLGSKAAVDVLQDVGDVIGYDPTADLTTPPPPTGVICAAGFGTYTIQWDGLDGHAFRNPSYAEVWGGPTNVLGNAIKLGTSTSNFFLDRGNLGETKFFWVRFVSQANVVGPYHSTTPVTGTLGKIGNADLSDLAVTAAKLADGAVDLSTNKVKNATNFGAIAVGYTVTQYLLATSGVMQNLVVDNAQIANMSAAKLTVGDGTVGGVLKSGNWASNFSGWKLNTDGSAELNNISARGQINGGAYTSYSWPSGSGTGFHLSAQGLLLGNANTGKYFQVEANGNVWAPNFRIVDGTAHYNGSVSGGAITGNAWPPAGGGRGFYLGPEALLLGNGNDNRYFQFDIPSGSVFAPQFSIVNGNAAFAGTLSAAIGTFSGTLTAAAVNAVNTINIAGEAVTIPRWSYSAGRIATVSLTIPSGVGGARVLVIGSVACPNTGWNQYVKINGSIVRTENVINGSVPSLMYSTTLSSGTHTIEIENSDSAGFNACCMVLYTMR